jgi:TonB-linked SusC/RagA family outer membrane protein
MRNCLLPSSVMRLWAIFKQHRSKNLLLISFIFITCFVHAQQVTVTGRVASGDTSLSNVSVVVKGTSSGTLTDANGRFSLSAPPNATLVFSSLGFNPREIKLNNRTQLDIQLESTTQQMEQVVVVGYGTQRKATLTGSVSSIKGSELAKTPTMNVTNSLGGRLPGLVTLTPSGEPGYDGSILRIRGINTLNNNNPLIVVDGIPGRSLDRLDPSTVESVSVLKDASAAIYGAQAANGVIIVTTKRGRPGKPTISASFNQGFGKPTRVPKMADAATYATMLNEINFYRSVDAANWVSSWDAYTKGTLATKPIYTEAQIQKFKDGSDPWNYPNTDWFEEVLRPWSGQNYLNVSLNGGSPTMRYFVSLSGRTQDGYYHHSGTKYNQYDFRTNLDGDINQYISLGFDVSGRLEDRNFPTRSAGSIFRMVMRGKPNMTAYWPNGTPGPDIEYGDNPVVVSTKATGYDHDKRYVLNTNGKLNIKIPWVRGLSLTGNAAIDKTMGFRKLWQTPWYLYSFAGFDANNQPILNKAQKGYSSPALTEYSSDVQDILLNGLLNYERTFSSVHDFRFLVGVERITSKGDNFSAYRKNFISTALDQMFAGAQDQYMSNDGSAFTQARLNYFGRVNYAYKEKYLAEFVWRYQGSYIFPEESRFGFFPGVSVGYKISEENFWKSIQPVVNTLKLRASWGRTGNDQIPEWQYLSIYSLGGIRAQPGNAPLSFITNGGTENAALYEALVPNAGITWEVANQADVGLDATLLHQKLNITFDYFDYRRSEILWQRNASVPTSTGLFGLLPKENIGRVANKGYDFSISYNNLQGKLAYQIGLNGGHQKNKILFWDEVPGDPDYKKSTGRPIGSTAYYQAIGIFTSVSDVAKYPYMASLNPKPGDVIYEDVNQDGKIDANDQVRNDKSEVPTFTGGLTFGLQFKGFDISLLVQGATGGVRYISTESGEIGNFLQSFAEDRWTPTNPNASGPRTFNRSNEYWVGGNTYFLHKTDYIRLKNFEIGYSFAHNLIKKAGLQNLRFYVNGYNWLTYSPDMKDFDPEMGTGSGQGYPLQKIINFGASVTF